MRALTVEIGFLLLVSSAGSQVAPQVIPEADARQHLIQHSEPIYPAIAQAAQVTGDVVIRVTIDGSGHVISERTVSGPPMLIGAAMGAVKTWQFSPFEIDGHAVQATTTLTIPFRLPGPSHTAEQGSAAQAWFALSQKCQSAMKAQDVQGALTICKEALDTALKTGNVTPSDQLCTLDSYQSYGHALLAAGELQEALAAENKAVDAAKARLTDTDEEYAWPFFWRAIVEARLGQTDAALADFTLAEETLRRAILHLPDAKKLYRPYLASVLETHAILLDQLGKTDDAQRLRAEAAILRQP